MDFWTRKTHPIMPNTVDGKPTLTKAHHYELSEEWGQKDLESFQRVSMSHTQDQ